MTMRRIWILMMLALFLAGHACSVFAFGFYDADDNANKDENTNQGVKAKGVVWDIAPDRKVVGTGGVYQPEGLDIYMNRQMQKITDQINGLKGQIDNVQKDVKEMKDLLRGQKA